MTTADYFYPGFEYAGFETPLDGALTWALCAIALSSVAIRDAVRNTLGVVAPIGEPVFDA